MFRVAFWILLIGNLFAAPASEVRAADLSKVDRTIRKQPVYKGQPHYALLLFGPEAKTRVWVVKDGETLYVDRNGDGDLTGKDERLTLEYANQNLNGYGGLRNCNIEIRDADKQTRYVIQAIGIYPENDKTKAELHLDAVVEIKGPRVSYRQYCDAQLGASPDKAAIAHYHGPLMIEPRRIYWKLTPELSRLPTGDPAGEISAVVGTMDAERGCWVVVRSEELPKDLHPVVEVEYRASKTGAAIKQRYRLEQRC
jgi:hypothetical protein